MGVENLIAGYVLRFGFVIATMVYCYFLSVETRPKKGEKRAWWDYPLVAFFSALMGLITAGGLWCVTVLIVGFISIFQPTVTDIRPLPNVNQEIYEINRGTTVQGKFVGGLFLATGRIDSVLTYQYALDIGDGTGRNHDNFVTEQYGRKLYWKTVPDLKKPYYLIESHEERTRLRQSNPYLYDYPNTDWRRSVEETWTFYIPPGSRFDL